MSRKPFHLTRAEMIDRTEKRRSIEKGHLRFWLRRGRGSYHLENVHQLESLLRLGLRVTGLLDRGRRNALDVRLRSLEFFFPFLPPGLDGFRLLHLSDLHLDGCVGLAARLAEVIARVTVDLCVLTGDYRFEVYGPCDDVYRELGQVIPAIRARHGIVGILGNHDFLEEAERIEEMGVRMLVNASTVVHVGNDELWLIGLDDPHYYGCDDLPTALQGVPADRFKILLVHSPEMMAEASEAGMSLYLCGHTHAGQIRLPGLGPLIVNAACPRAYVSGAWTYRNMTGHTSPGVGTSLLPVRFFCPPEATVIRLRRGERANTI